MAMIARAYALCRLHVNWKLGVCRFLSALAAGSSQARHRHSGYLCPGMCVGLLWTNQWAPVIQSGVNLSGIVFSQEEDNKLILYSLMSVWHASVCRSMCTVQLLHRCCWTLHKLDENPLRWGSSVHVCPCHTQVSFSKPLADATAYRLVLPAGTRYNVLSGPTKAELSVSLAGLRKFRLPLRQDWQVGGWWGCGGVPPFWKDGYLGIYSMCGCHCLCMCACLANAHLRMFTTPAPTMLEHALLTPDDYL